VLGHLRALRGPGAWRTCGVTAPRPLFYPAASAKEEAMTRALRLGVLAVLLAACPPGAADEDKGGKKDALDPAKLVGTWNLVSGVRDGAKLDKDALKGTSVVLTKDTLTLKGKEETFVLKYKVDAKKKPATVELEITKGPRGVGATSTGIIALKGDELSLCYHPEGAATPKTFESKTGSKLHLFVLKRAKKKE
jgi:uncharacterized protein (TIGR03067 family)